MEDLQNSIFSDEKDEMEIKEFIRYLDEYKEPFQCFLKDNWYGFKVFFMKNPAALHQRISITGLTPFHFASLSNDHELVRYLLEMIQPSEWRQELQKQSIRGNTPLHVSITRTNVAVPETLLEYEKKAANFARNAGKEEEGVVPLLEIKNNIGETPVYRAGSFGRTRMLQLFKKHVDMKKHYKRDFDKKSILHAAVVAQEFEAAVWLMKLDGASLANMKEDSGLTCFQLLAKMSSAFRSQTRMGSLRQLIYSVLPNPHHGSDDDGDQEARNRRDVEDGHMEKTRLHKVEELPAISRIYQGLWKYLTKGLDWKEVENVWELKRKHKFAEQLVELFIKEDFSWCRTKEATVSTGELSLGPADELASCSVDIDTAEKEEARKENVDKNQKPVLHTPLLIAASNGITEIVEQILKTHPQACEYISDDGEKLLHIAVKYRRSEIYDLIDTSGRISLLSPVINTQGYSVLHQAATVLYYGGSNQPGPVLQLQDELEWFGRVEKIVPPHYILHNNKDNKTAKQLFDKEHQTMHKEARKWIKETAQSCSAVAVLVATVVFAAAFTVPGGSNEEGYPVFLHSPVFLFFVVIDVAGLSSSLASVVMFLSILTSPCEMEDFRASLPRKLTMGFTLLFFSLASTMLAFTATIFLVIKLEKNKLTSTLIYTAALLPISIFALLQFPLYVGVQNCLVYTFKQIRKVLPSYHCLSSRAKKIVE